ncbi:MAG: hypothetical protein AAFY11_11090 [Cyanobacteria bacterium J06641_5]
MTNNIDTSTSNLNALTTGSDSSAVAKRSLTPDIATALGFPSTTLETEAKSFSNFLPDPWKFIGEDPVEDLGELRDISLALIRTTRPNFILRSVLSYRKSSFGWKTTGLGKRLTVQLKDSKDGSTFYSYQIPLVPGAPSGSLFEITIRCNDDNRFFSHTEELNIDVFDQIKYVGLNADAHTWNGC